MGFPQPANRRFELARRTQDAIREDRLIWEDPEGQRPFNDPLDAQDTFINSFYTHAKYAPLANLHVTAKLKFESSSSKARRPSASATAPFSV